MTIDLRLGRWQDALADVEMVDAVITDPPFSERVHSGQRTGSSTRKTTLSYSHVDEAYCRAFAESWAPRTQYWALVFSDHQAQAWWESAWEAAGWYVFAPVIWLRTCPTPRLAGDGPTSACDYVTVARPRRRLERERIGSRPGYYSHPGNDGRENPHPGAKALDPMRSILLDYTLPGDLVCDPHAGSATTLLAAAIEGRRAIGAEMDPNTFAKAQKRIAKGWTPAMRFDAAPEMKQEPLL